MDADKLILDPLLFLGGGGPITKYIIECYCELYKLINESI